MNRRFLRITLLALIALVALASVWQGISAGFGVTISVQSSQTPRPIAFLGETKTGACVNEGITLVVDFGSRAKRDPQIFCVIGEGPTGWQVLTESQLNPEGTLQYPTGFLCRLDDYPSKTEQDCANTPTVNEGHWAYFYASAATGNNWLASGIGAAQRKPLCGDYEGWLFESSKEYDEQAVPAVTAKPFTCSSQK